MELIDKYLPRKTFESYEDFKTNFKINIPADFNFAVDIVDEWAKNEPDKKALIYCTDEGEERIFTFAEISALSKKAAAWLLEKGIKKGDRVLTLLRRRWEYWIIAVALDRIGAVVVPASIQMTEKDIVYRINTSSAVMLIALADEFVLRQIENVQNKCPSLKNIATVADGCDSDYQSFDKEFLLCGDYNQRCSAGNFDEMVIYFTSGTSGYPKMAVHNRLYPLGHIVTAKFMQRVENNGLHLTQTDSGWAKFGWGNIYGQWICGSAILAYDPIRFNTYNFMRVTETYKPTTVCIPPTMYRFLLSDGLEKKHIASCHWFSTAGEPLSGEVNRQFKNITGLYIHEGFGQSEGTPITCGFGWLEVRPSSMGKPSPLYDVKIVNAEGKECDTGETGEIVIRVKDKKEQLGLLDYYFIDGKKINPIINGLYHTGDTAYMDEDGYFWYVGRIDDMIKCSGYRIGPFEIESVLNTHPSVKESAIVGAPDSIRGQIVCAVVALKSGFYPSDTLTRELQTYVKKNTAPYKYPRKIVYVKNLPKTTTGKVIRKLAKELIK
jgi:acetyl-CoA synthetase